MSKHSLTTHSIDGIVTQILNWDTMTRIIGIVHQINVPAYKDAVFNQKVRYPYGSAGYDQVCQEYGLNPNDRKVITRYIYDQVDDSKYQSAHIVEFPGGGNSYQIIELPMVVACKFVGNETSTTSGEALAH